MEHTERDGARSAAENALSERVLGEEARRLHRWLVKAVRNNDTAAINAALLTPAAKLAGHLRRTALMDAVEFSRFEPQASIESLRLLLAASDMCAQDFNGMTPLMFAAGSFRLDAVELLLPLSDANARDKEGRTALMHAVRSRSPELVSALVAASDPKAVDACGRSAFMLAAFLGETECLRRLLPVSDVNARTTGRDHRNQGVGWTALMIACDRGESDCVAALLRVSNAKARDPDEKTALTLAIDKSRAACADLLAEHSERSEADAALQKFGAALMPRWSRRLAQLEADAIAQEVGLRVAGATASGAQDAPVATTATLAPRAAAKRL